MSADDRRRGLYNKFSRIERTDGRHRPGEKHHACEYFVLDLRHDPHAVPAIRAYAASCKNEYPVLALDLEWVADQLEAAGEDAPRGFGLGWGERDAK